MHADPSLLSPGAAHRTGIIVAERLALARDGLVRLLSDWRHGPVSPAATLPAAAALLAADPDSVLLLDEGLAAPGLDAALRDFRMRFPSLRIVVMADVDSRDAVLLSLAAGAHGFAAKSAGFAELAQAIEAVRHGGVHVPRSALRSEAPPATPDPARGTRPATRPPLPVDSLTGRQRDVLRLLAEGRSTKDIARTLDLAVSTIKVHLAAVYRTVGARNRVEALCRAGALPPLSHST